MGWGEETTALGRAGMLRVKWLITDGQQRGDSIPRSPQKAIGEGWEIG